VRTQEFFLAGSNPDPATFRRVWALLGEGADEEAIEEAASGDAAGAMAAATAARLLRRAAEARAIAPGAGEPPIDAEALHDKARRGRARLDTMLRYAFGRGCRTRFIYDYFAGAGRGGTIPRCGTCDVCLGWRRAEGRALDDREFERVRIALSAVARLPARFGVERIAQVLAGSRSREVLDRRLDHIPTFGRLAELGLEEIKRLLDVLLEAGLLERRGIEGGRPGAFVVALTVEGVAVMRAERRPLLALPLPAAEGRPAAGRLGAIRRQPDAGGSPDAPEPDAALLARLREWRAAEAKRRGVPAYVIFHDTTLAALAVWRPRDRGGLRAVRGVGPAKVEAYGETLLRVLAGGAPESGAARARPRRDGDDGAPIDVRLRPLN
jgi:ATP-dependent DNA helicase RecQ